MVRYLNPADDNPRRITKADKNFAKRLDFKDIKFPVKIRGIYKIEKRIPSALSLYAITLYVIHYTVLYVDLLLIGEGEKNTMFLSKISIYSCLIIHYNVEEHILVVIVYTFSLQKNFKASY